MTDEERPSSPRVGWAIYHLLDCIKPLESEPARYLLGASQSCVLATTARNSRRALSDGTARVQLAGDDDDELHLQRTEAGWLAQGEVLLNGRTARSPALHDGDLFGWRNHIFMVRRGAFLAGESPPDSPIQTFSPELQHQLETLGRIARSTVPVLITGESGTGKELIARAVHAQSGRPGRFVAVNCGALPEGLIPGQFFGHKKGSFSGAVADHAGFVRDADGGTLFLDEIGDLPSLAQATLLRTLQENEVTPIGTTRAIKINLRIVTATHRDLEALVASGGFRGDLYARLLGFTIELPPLRQRSEDLGLLIRHLIKRVASSPSTVRFTCPAAMALLGYPWPLNVRELEHCLSAATILAGSEAIALEHLPRAVRLHCATLPRASKAEADGAVPSPPQLPRARKLTEEDQRRRQHLVDLLIRHRGNVAAVATAAGKARMQIHRWIRRYEIDLSVSRSIR